MVLTDNYRSSHTLPSISVLHVRTFFKGRSFGVTDVFFWSKSQKKRWRRENLKNGAGDIFVWYLHSFGTSRIRSWSIVFLIFFEDFPKFGFCSERVSHTFSFHVRAPNSTVLHTHTPSISVLHTHTLSSSVLQTHTPTNPVICILPQVCPTYNGSKTYCCWKKSCATSNTNTYSYWD